MAWHSPYILALQQYSVNRKTGLSLQPVGHKLPAPAFAYTCTGWVACKFTDRSECWSETELSKNCHSATVPASSVIPGFLRLKARRIAWHPCVLPAATPVLHRVLSVQRLTDVRPSVIAPGRAVPFAANDSATWVCCWRFPPPRGHHCQQADPPGGYPRRFELSVSPRLEALACFVHRVDHRHDSDMEF